MDAGDELAEQQIQYDGWAISRIIEGKACCLHDDLKCIPIRDKNCMNCYKKDISTIERTQSSVFTIGST